MGSPDEHPQAQQPATREYRSSELAKEAGITTRTLRFYRERKLLPAPRREGRIAWYNDHHLARLRTIGGLLARGHTLGGIAELLAAFEHAQDGRGAAERLGLDQVLGGPWSEETPVRLAPEEMAGYFGREVTGDDLTASVDLGYVAVDGDELVHASQRLLEASSALVREGVPLSAVLDAGREVRAHADAIAELFATLVRTHLLRGILRRLRSTGCSEPPTELVQQLTDALARLRPLSRQVIDAELSMALDRRVRAELADWLPAPADAAPTASGPTEQTAGRVPGPTTSADQTAGPATAAGQASEAPGPAEPPQRPARR